MKTMIAAVGSLVLGLASMAAQADTVVSITQYSYDYMNRPICRAVRMNMAISQSADACTPSTTVGNDGPDRITKNVYDAAGQLLAVYQGVGTSDIRQYAYYNYTNNGLKSFEIDANHNKTTFTYDGFDRLSKVQYPNTTAGNEVSSTTDYETFGYDANSNRTSYRHRNAQTVLYTYDNLNREIFKDLPAYAGATATAKDIYTGYDGLGHIVYKRFGSTAGSGVSYSYDGLGRVSSTTDINNRAVWYGYFADSTRYYLQFPDSVIQGYAYDNKGALIATSSGAVGLGVAYNSLGKTVAVTRSNSAHSFYAYDNVGRLNVMALDFAGTGNDITWWITGYNPANQITNWNASTAVYDYVESATDQTNKTYDGLNRDASIAAVSGGYDTAGNMANDGVRTFTYDVENRLITGSSALTALTLNYDPEGRLYSYSYNGSTTSFLYDGTNLIGEYDGTGAMTRRYMHTLGTDQPWVQFTGSAVTAASATYLYSNYQGSIIAMADQNGAVAASDVFKYGPYGEPRNSANAESWTGSRFRYTGQTVIPEAKLYYYKARVYDPIAGRFLQTDPVGSKDDLDLYAYVAGDPINKTDPTGKDGFGFTAGWEAEIGIGFIGAAAQGSVSGGEYWDGNGNKIPGSGYSETHAGEVAQVDGSKDPDAVLGASAGAGVGLFYTNANSVQETGGPFKTISVNTPVGSVQYSWDPKSKVWVVAATVGPSVGASISKITTNTTKTTTTPPSTPPKNCTGRSCTAPNAPPPAPSSKPSCGGRSNPCPAK